MLNTVHSALGEQMEVLIFDGGFVQDSSLAAEIRVMQALGQAASVMIPVKMKSWSQPVQTVAQDVVRCDMAIVDSFPAMSHTYGNCLLDAVASIEPECTMNFVTMQTQSDTGISEAEFNLAMQHDSQRSPDTSFRLPHYTGQNIEEHAKVNKHWLCHQGFPDGSGHWWVVSFDLSGNVRLLDVQAQEFALLLKNADLETSCRKFDNITWFRLTRCQHDVHLPVDGPYALRGNGPRAQGRLAVQDKVYTTSRNTCVPCGCDLLQDRPIKARLYGFDGCTIIQHMPKRCRSMDCRCYHHYNYRREQGQKFNILTGAPSLDDVVFINSKTAFTMKFVKYHGAWQFRAGLSVRAIAWAQEEVLGCLLLLSQPTTLLGLLWLGTLTVASFLCFKLSTKRFDLLLSRR